MRFALVGALVLIILHSSLVAPMIAAEPSITEQELIRRTQEMMDAVASGNKEPWQKYYADDCIYADEKGRLLDKAKLIADITQLPSGYSGVIKVEHVLSRIIGDTAILAYDMNETEIIFGQELHARYHSIDTWLHRNGSWQIIASQANRYYEDPTVGQADAKKFSDFIGVYELAPGQTRTISAENGQLFDERKGKKQQLFPETTDIFFRKGIEGRILFHYDASDRVDSLIDRRNNEDVVWKKTK